MIPETSEKISKLILVIEDAVILRDSLKEILILEGFDVVTAANGQEALDYLMQGMRGDRPRGKMSQKPTLILLDLDMPVMNGVEFLTQLAVQSDLSQIPVIVCSGSQNNLDNLKIKPAAIVPKPFDIEELIAACKRHSLSVTVSSQGQR